MEDKTRVNIKCSIGEFFSNENVVVVGLLNVVASPLQRNECLHRIIGTNLFVHKTPKRPYLDFFNF